ncbi:MAG: hypothetical protein QXZ70_07165 [Candidatus Bathyarchaeia archaeon]
MEMETKNVEEKVVEFTGYDYDPWGFPDEDKEGLEPSIVGYIDLLINDRFLYAYVAVQWEFDKDNKNFTICADLIVFEDGGDMVGEDFSAYVALKKISLHDFNLIVENERGERVEIDPEDHAWLLRELAYMISEEIEYCFAREAQMRCFVDDAIDENFDLLERSDVDDPDALFVLKVSEEVLRKVVERAFKEVKAREIKILYSEDGCEIL